MIHTHRNKVFDVPPLGASLDITAVSQAGYMSDNPARQSAIAVAAFQYADKPSGCDLVREALGVLRKAMVEGDRDFSLVPRHRLVLVFTGVKATAEQNHD